MPNLKPTSNQLSTFNPSALSHKWFIVAIFPKNKTVNYPLAVSVAKGAPYYAVYYAENTEVHVAGFRATMEDLSRFSLLHQYIKMRKDASFYAGGRILPDWFHAKYVAGCYMQSLECKDNQSYCFTVIEHPHFNKDRNTQILIPCHLLTSMHGYIYIDWRMTVDSLIMKLSKHHPSKLPKLVRAIGVEKCIEWCPNFRPEKTRLIKKGDVMTIPRRPKNPVEKKWAEGHEKMKAFRKNWVL